MNIIKSILRNGINENLFFKLDIAITITILCHLDLLIYLLLFIFISIGP